jgi:tetratricopeptide (TPR) repeat protein
MLKRTIIPMLFCLSAVSGFAGTPASERDAQATTPVVGQPACADTLPTLEKTLATMPGDAVLHNRVGVCYQQLGERKRARREFEQATALNGKLAEAWNNLGTLDHFDRKYGRAIARYQRAVELNPVFAVAFKNMGSAYLAKNEIDKGIAAYREALRIDATILEASAPLSIATNDLDAAKLYFYLAKLCAGNGRVEAALDFLAKARAAGFGDFDRVRHDGDFKAVVADARFAMLK